MRLVPRNRRSPGTPPAPLIDAPSAAAPAGKPDVGFVACIEGGNLEAQALLLFESIRLHAGRFRDCPIYALTPRAGHAISEHARRRLEGLGVRYSDTVLNTECPVYGSANRVAAAAHVEETFEHDILVILDSDAIFVREPADFLLPPGVDVAVRPVDVKGISTRGRVDECDAYWRDLCRSSGVDYAAIPWIESLVDRRRIKANYNGGLVVARGNLGLMRRWADIFFTSVGNGLRPRPVAGGFQSGAGWVEPDAGAFWGSNQAALSLAIWSTTRSVQHLPPNYNYPLHRHNLIGPARADAAFRDVVHVHYHWTFAKDALPANPLLLPSGPLSPAQRRWLRRAVPIG